MNADLLAVARAGVVEQATVAIDEAAWPRFRSGVEHHRLTGLATDLAVGGGLDLAPDQLRTLGDLDVRAARQAVALELLLLALVDALPAPVVLLKGPSLAHRVYGQPTQRPFADLDLLVGGDSIDEAVAVARGLGAERLRPELAAGFDRRFAKSVSMRTPDGLEIDWHRTLFLGPFQTLVPVDALWAWTEPWTFLERDLLVFRHPMALVHTASDLALNWNHHVVNLRDVWELGRRCEPVEVAAAARQTRLGAPAAAGLRRVIAEFGDPTGMLAAHAAAIEPGRTSRLGWRLARRATTPRRQTVGAALGTRRPDHALRILWSAARRP